jgi:CAAX prenyl protease-like protein
MNADPASAPDSPTPGPEAESGPAGLIKLLPYIAPLLVFLLLTSLEGYLPDGRWYPAAYAVKVLLVALVSWHYRSAWFDLRPVPPFRTLALATIVGLLVFVLWIRLEGWYPEIGLLGKRTGFDPTSLTPEWRWPFLTVRFVGLVLLVPLIEELFWRSFLIRWLINPDFHEVPLGQVTPMAAAVTSALFGLTHPEWLPAILTGLLWAWLLWQSKSLSACVLSHAVANLALGIHVVSTGDWKYW